LVTLGWILVCVGLILACIAAAVKHSAQKQWKWERTTGAITHSGVQMSSGSFHPEIEYRYEYRSCEYRSQRLRSLEITVNWRGPSEKIAAAYPVGAEVTVYVDPNYPREAVLEPGGHWGFLPFFFTFSTGCVLAGVWLISAS
jgi:hypothetical protein